MSVSSLELYWHPHEFRGFVNGIDAAIARTACGFASDSDRCGHSGVGALRAGCALHLIGSIDGLVSAVLEQLLNVLKWLATVAGALLVLFTLALLTKLPGLVFSGRHAIGADWLLWLVAVIVLFLNAAYRDGRVDRPYPRWIAQAFRFAVPLTRHCRDGALRVDRT